MHEQLEITKNNPSEESYLIIIFGFFKKKVKPFCKYEHQWRSGSGRGEEEEEKEYEEVRRQQAEVGEADWTALKAVDTLIDTSWNESVQAKFAFFDNCLCTS